MVHCNMKYRGRLVPVTISAALPALFFGIADLEPQDPQSAADQEICSVVLAKRRFINIAGLGFTCRVRVHRHQPSGPLAKLSRPLFYVDARDVLEAINRAISKRRGTAPGGSRKDVHHPHGLVDSSPDVR